MFEKLSQFKMQLWILVITCLLLNVNTLKNEYALDDEIIIIQNLNVQAGFSGIGEILKTDSFQGYLDMAGAESPISGGRYRPLSIVTFAIEQSLFGETYGLEYRALQEELASIENSGTTDGEVKKQMKKMSDLKTKIETSNLNIAPFRHFIQLLLFIISLVVMLVFLRKHIFTNNPILAFITVLLFLIHPVHTEVIANIKSRDEILSLLFIVLTLHFSFSYAKTKTKRSLNFLTLSFISALLSKEYAMILPFIVIVAYYTVLEKNVKELFNPAIFRLIFIGGVFVFIRFAFFNSVKTDNVTSDVLNIPYLFATPAQAFASKVALLWEYLRVLLVPFSLSSDYSYHHFQYLELTNWKFIISLLLYIGLALTFIYTVKKRNKTAFPLAIFLGFLILVNNLVFNIGATMGERFVYHSSVGLCIIVVMLGEIIYLKLKIKTVYARIIFSFILLPIVLLFSFKTIDRNSEWKSNYTLFSADIKTVPNSALVNCNVGTETYNNAYAIYSTLKKPSSEQTKIFRSNLQIAIKYLDKAIEIHPKYVVAYLNRGLCYFYLNNEEKVAKNWIKAAQIFPDPHPFLKKNVYVFFDKGLYFGSKKIYEEAVKPLEIASKINPYDSAIWNNLGGAYFMTGQFKLASDAFSEALLLNSELVDAANGKRAAEAINNLENKLKLNPLDKNTRNELQKAYQSCGVSRKFLQIKL